MAYTVNWITKEIFVPKEDLILISDLRYRLPMNNFHREIRRLEWEFSEGLWADQILVRQESTTISGQTSFPTDTIINNYKVIFDPDIVSVLLEGSNNNVIDVFVPNGVSVIPTNSFGNSLIEVPSQLTGDQLQAIADAVWNKEICP